MEASILEIGVYQYPYHPLSPQEQEELVSLLENCLVRRSDDDWPCTGIVKFFWKEEEKIRCELGVSARGIYINSNLPGYSHTYYVLRGGEELLAFFERYESDMHLPSSKDDIQQDPDQRMFSLVRVFCVDLSSGSFAREAMEQRSCFSHKHRPF